MIASSRTARTSSGRISGVGLASAKMIGCFAIRATHSFFTAPATLSPTNTSAPSSASAIVRCSVCSAKRALYGS